MPKKFGPEFPRFVAKVKDSSKPRQFSVYDRERASYPALVPGFGEVAQNGTEAEMTAEAARLEEFTASS